MIRHIKIILCISLTILTLVVFWQVQDHGFINFDDGLYILENPHVRSGLNLKNLNWAFTTVHGGFWFPLTWLSHMLDCQLYGLNPQGHHLNNLLFHLINTILLFLVFNRMTGALWRSAFVAALFALHPLHVEPVAWASSRKDVLSTLFWMLTMWFYVSYAKHPRTKEYLLVLLFFILGLMSKPMLVTLPFVLLLLDFWPLGLLRPAERPDDHGRLSAHAKSIGQRRVLLSRLILEKLPFLLLAFISSYIVFMTEQSVSALVSLESVPMHIRFANSTMSYVNYIIKMIWPVRLSVFYPYPEFPSWWKVLGAGFILISISCLVIKSYRTHPYLLTGWFWYLGTLIPVIGLIQIGSHAMADRYAYVPLIGLFIMVSWGISDLAEKVRIPDKVLSLCGISLVLILAFCSWHQLDYWKNDIMLFRHAVNATSGNYFTYYHLGNIYRTKGKYKEAAESFRETIRIKPGHLDARNNLGIVLALQGKYDEAEAQFKKTLQIRPDHERAHTNLGIIFYNHGEFEKAIGHFREALRIKPDHPYEYNDLGKAYLGYGDFNNAIDHFLKALKLNPESAEVQYNIGVAFEKNGDLEKAVAHYNNALKIDPEFSGAQRKLEMLLHDRHQPTPGNRLRLESKDALQSTDNEGV